MKHSPNALPADACLALPAPARLGHDYYRARASDYAARHSQAGKRHAPPDYYLAYGDRYARRFTSELRPRLSPAGRTWLDATYWRLQALLEARRAADPRRFAALEEDPIAFRQFAFSTHAQAYVECGVASLPLPDLLRIACTPDLRDLLTVDALRQVFAVVRHIARAALGRLAAAATALRAAPAVPRR